MRELLFPFAVIFDIITSFKNWFFDINLLKSNSVWQSNFLKKKIDIDDYNKIILSLNDPLWVDINAKGRY